MHAVETSLDEVASTDLRRALGYAIRAPSSHNSQPWRFRIVRNGVELHADHSRLLAVVDPHGRELAISCGAALSTLCCALQYMGYGTVVTPLPDGHNRGIIARVECSRFGTRCYEERLFDAIQRRQTHRGPFLNKALPPSLPSRLLSAATSTGSWLVSIDSHRDRTQLAELVAEGDRLQYADRSFRRELASWLRPNTSTARDGLPGYTLGLGRVTSWIAPALVRRFDIGKGLARTDRELVLRAPALFILGTERDEPLDWIGAGQALGRMLLLAAADSVSVGFMNQPVQCPALRPRLNQLLGRAGFAQLIMRFGCAKLGPMAGRRQLEEVVD